MRTFTAVRSALILLFIAAWLNSASGQRQDVAQSLKVEQHGITVKTSDGDYYFISPDDLAQIGNRLKAPPKAVAVPSKRKNPETRLTFHQGEPAGIIVFFGGHAMTDRERDELLLWLETDDQAKALLAKRFPGTPGEDAPVGKVKP